MENSTGLTPFTDDQSKADLAEPIKDGEYLQPDKNILVNLYKFFEHIGAVSSMPTDQDKQQQTAKRKGYMEDFLQYFFVRNNKVAYDMPFGFLFTEFANGVICGDYTRKGNNTAALIDCLNQNIDQINRQWQKQKAGETPALPEPRPINFKDWTDDTLRRRYNTLTEINETRGMRDLFRNEKGNSYFKRIKEEYERRFR